MLTNDLEIAHVTSECDARELRRAGYCPVECWFGDVTVIDELSMDCHGSLRSLGGVAGRAYLSRFGARKERKQFVVTGPPTATKTLAIAGLCELLPHQSRLAAVTKDQSAYAVRCNHITDVVKLADRLAANPVGINLTEERGGALLLLWNRLMSNSRPDKLSFLGGVMLWSVLSSNERLYTLLAQAVSAEEAVLAGLSKASLIQRISDAVAVVDYCIVGFKPWYEQVAPVIVWFNNEDGRTGVGCRDKAAAEAVFGEGGLRNVLPHLIGWSGEESHGCGPQHIQLTREHVVAEAQFISSFVQPGWRSRL